MKKMNTLWYVWVVKNMEMFGVAKTLNCKLWKKGLPAPSAQHKVQVVQDSFHQQIKWNKIRQAATLSWRSRSRRSLTQATCEEFGQPRIQWPKPPKIVAFQLSWTLKCQPSTNHPTIHPIQCHPFQIIQNDLWPLKPWKLKISKLKIRPSLWWLWSAQSSHLSLPNSQRQLPEVSEPKIPTTKKNDTSCWWKNDVWVNLLAVWISMLKKGVPFRWQFLSFQPLELQDSERWA